MQRHGLPTAGYRTFTDAGDAHAYVAGRGAPIVIKADGLAAGKGVVVAETLAEADAAIDAMLVDNTMGSAGARVVIEDFLEGEEASFIVMVDGRHVLPLASSQDHKRLQDGDRGPNTGGMGAYSPAPIVTPALHARIMREIIDPAVNGMAADGTPYTGFLYAGVMIDGAGHPKVLEFNCRMGDPETQPIIARLKSDLVDLLQHAVDGALDTVEAEWDRRAALGVVVAAAGYPDAPRKGAAIGGLDRVTADTHPGVHVFHAGTALQDGRVVVSGGRVLCVTALGDSVRLAQRAAYAAVSDIHFDGMQYRTDIGHRALSPRKP
jgi:phosphoribosylamine--glycine ligase